MTEPRFTILLGGTLVATDRVRAAVADSRVIAADSGMRHAAALGLLPELWVGDFDSADQALLDAWPEVERQPYPAQKAATDGEIAISEAIARGARSLLLLGAMGGERSDHALQHFAQALQLKAEGFEVMLSSGEEEGLPLLAGEIEVDLPGGSLFSIVGFSRLDGLSIRGARYPLENFTLPFGSSRTISNVALGPVHLTLEGGCGLFLARPHDMTGA
nr:thiamine diphosphokinase [uncultured Gellertiella sp.]